ncbi:hypothetical protein CPB83DRAFT_859242 [Crepidotus variabilis]|uniref:Uncharacterized protein n=1 Tax=Crepidotus variabilis TaxID=179855 RepID=A0A9P6EB17_9AGAR|nr:hypothetical protein CPB83DRAFT_859242 [Crepidotus variabilis]
MVMAGQRYCTGVPWQKSFQDAVKQTGANGVTGLKLMAEGIGRGPVGMLAGVAKATAKAIIDAKKTTKKTSQKSAKRIATKSPKRTAKKTPKKTAKKSVKHAAKKNVKHSAKRSVKHSPKKSTQRNARKSVKHSPKKSVKPSPKKSVKPSPKRSVKPSTNKGGKKKRELADENDILNRRDFEIVARDEDFSLVERGEYSTFDLVVRNEDGSLNVRQCEMYNGDTSCQ